MRLIRKYHPEHGPTIPNQFGAIFYRVVAIFKDDVNTMYICFYDTSTVDSGQTKIYIEEAHVHLKLGGVFETSDLWQIRSDEEWEACMAFLNKDEIGVLETVTTHIDTDMNETQLNRELFKLPRTSEGVDIKGRAVQNMPESAKQSPSIYLP
jgi:hypothetical protein